MKYEIRESSGRASNGATYAFEVVRSVMGFRAVVFAGTREACEAFIAGRTR